MQPDRVDGTDWAATPARFGPEIESWRLCLDHEPQPKLGQFNWPWVLRSALVEIERLRTFLSVHGIVQLEAERDALRAALDAVLIEHWQTSTEWGGERRPACGRCTYGDGVPFLWPCPTRRAVTGEPEPDPHSTAAAATVPPAPTEPTQEQLNRMDAGDFDAYMRSRTVPPAPETPA